MTLKQVYENNIGDVAMEISISKEWRRKIFRLGKGEFLTISYEQPDLLPSYIKDEIVFYKLTYYVEIPPDCPEKFDEGLVVFKFWAKEYPDVVRYSGNNPNIC